MHFTYVPKNTDFWIHYYKDSISAQPQYQLGGEISGFRGYPQYYHRGAGIGNFFKSLFRLAMPMLKTVGKHALVTGSKIADDVAQGRNLKESALERAKQATGTLLHEVGDRVQRGKGLGRRKRSTNRIKKVKMYKRKHAMKRKSFRKRKLRRTVGSDIFTS